MKRNQSASELAGVLGESPRLRLTLIRFAPGFTFGRRAFPDRSNAVRRRPRGARPGGKFLGLVEQPLGDPPEREIDGAAALLVVERRMALCLLERFPVFVVDPEIERVLVTMPNITPSQNTPVLPNIRRMVMPPSGASCSRRNSAKDSLATILDPSQRSPHVRR